MANIEGFAAGQWHKPGYVPSAVVFKDVNRDKFKYAEHRVSEAEFKRRHKVMREFMDRHGLDCLLIAGGNDVWNRGFTNMRWVTEALACELSHYEWVIFPRNGDITILTYVMYAVDPGRRARTFVEDVRSTIHFGPALAGVIKEKGYEKGKIGIVEIASEPSIPMNHWKGMTEGAPRAEFEFVTNKWWMEVRLIKSQEEIEFLERAAAIGDKMMEAVEDNIRPGMTEADIFAVMDSAMLRNGGEIPTMVLAISFSMRDPSSTIVRETPMVRTLQEGDIILTEVAPRYPDGSECQTGRTFVIGEPTDLYAQMIEAMWDTQKRVLDVLRPGRNTLELRDVVEPTIKAGWILPAPLIHSELGCGVDAQPYIKSFTKMTWEQGYFELKPNITVTPEMFIATPDSVTGVYNLDTYVITDDAPRCLHKYPQKVVRL